MEGKMVPRDTSNNFNDAMVNNSKVFNNVFAGDDERMEVKGNNYSSPSDNVEKIENSF